jgi:hypothetical protein
MESDGAVTPIDDWRVRWWKLWSVQLGAIAAVLQSILLSFPDVALQAWSILPDDLKALLPVRWAFWIPVILTFAAVMLRFIQQGVKKNGAE